MKKNPIFKFFISLRLTVVLLAFSLVIIFTTFLTVYFMAKRRQGFGRKKFSEDG